MIGYTWRGLVSDILVLHIHALMLHRVEGVHPNVRIRCSSFVFCLFAFFGLAFMVNGKGKCFNLFHK